MASDFHLIDFPFLSTARAEVIGRAADWLALSGIGRICWPTSGSSAAISDRLAVYVHVSASDPRVWSSLIGTGKPQTRICVCVRQTSERRFLLTFNKHVSAILRSFIFSNYHPIALSL